MKRTVLIVDDDREVQRYLTGLLEAQGLRVICEKDGDWALKTFEQRRIDAVLLDILIPVMSGLEVAEAIRAHPRGKDVAIVMVTGIYRGAAHRAEAIRRYGLLDYLDKPIEGARIVQMLKQHFAKLDAPPAEGPRASEPPARASQPPPPDPEQRRERREVERAAKSVGETQFRGTLRKNPFPRLLHRLYRLGATGALFLLRGDVKKIVYFRDGHPIYVKSNQLSESLGALLVRERLINEKEHAESVRRMSLEKRRHGAILIEMGIISPHNLKYGLEVQLQAKLFDVFSWTEGEYQFKEGVKLPDESVTIDQSNATLILEGVRKGYDATRLDAATQPLAGQYVSRTADPELLYQDVALTDAERDLVARIDGRRTLGELLERAADRWQVQTLVYALLCCGALETTVRPAPPPQRPAPPPLPSDVGVRAGTPPPPRVAADARPGREALAATVLAMRARDHFALLGVDRAARQDEIEHAYATLATTYHPDRFRDHGAEVREMAVEAFGRLRTAYQVLRDPGERARYASGLGDDEPGTDPASRALAADRLFKLGESALKRRDFEEAESALRRAVELAPTVADYHAYLGWIIFCAGDRNASAERAAIAELQRAIELAPKLERAHLFLGYVHRDRGRRADAERRFEEALRANPDCQEAVVALRDLQRS